MSSGQDLAAYTRLTEKSARMQRELGAFGRGTYRPAYANYLMHDYEIVLNMLPDLHANLSNEVLARSVGTQGQINTLQEVMIRHRGVLLELRDALTRDLKNPVVWLREGVRFILELPARILRDLGLLSDTRLSAITESRTLKVLAAIGAIAAFVASLATIVGEWDALIGVFNRIVTAFSRDAA
jgi:hypothetical protein